MAVKIVPLAKESRAESAQPTLISRHASKGELWELAKEIAWSFCPVPEAKNISSCYLCICFHFPVPRPVDCFRMLVLANQWRWHVHDFCWDGHKELCCVGFQQVLPVHLHFAVHLCGAQLVHWNHQWYLRENQGKVLFQENTTMCENTCRACSRVPLSPISHNLGFRPSPRCPQKRPGSHVG